MVAFRAARDLDLDRLVPERAAPAVADVPGLGALAEARPDTLPGTLALLDSAIIKTLNLVITSTSTSNFVDVVTQAAIDSPYAKKWAESAKRNAA